MTVNEETATPRSWRGDRCTECCEPISPCSRGRCRRCAYSTFKRAVPTDFLIILKARGSLGAARYFHASLSTVTRWRRECGVKPQDRVVKSSTGKAVRRGFRQVPLNVQRDCSAAGLAAEFLQQSSPVFRCDHRGRLNPKGAFWHRGGYVLTDADVISRAMRMGWKPADA